jgi:hypothetical protein
MKIKYSMGLVLSVAALALAGCGGGGGSAAPTTTTIGGMASKGPIKAGQVKVFAIRNNTEDKSGPIGQGVTDANGNFSVDVGVFSGPVVLEVSGGTFTDEVSGLPVAMNSNTLLRAAVTNVAAGTQAVAVTPLTELAFNKARGTGTTLTAAAIDDANTKIAAQFQLKDIVATLPVAAGGADDQKKYAAALGAISQLVNDSKLTENEGLDVALDRVINQLGNDEKNNGNLSVDSITKLNAAITKFNGSGKNTTGFPVAAIATDTSGLLKISTAGTQATIGAIDMIVNLPAGVKVGADATGETTAGIVKASGVAAGDKNTLATAKFTAATAAAPAQLRIALINPTGFGLGECVTIKFDLDTGAGFPASATAFSVTGFAAKDISGSPLSGITVAPSSISSGG